MRHIAGRAQHREVYEVARLGFLQFHCFSPDVKRAVKNSGYVIPAFAYLLSVTFPVCKLKPRYANVIKRLSKIRPGITVGTFCATYPQFVIPAKAGIQRR
jgi:hypothetical protein